MDPVVEVMVFLGEQKLADGLFHEALDLFSAALALNESEARAIRGCEAARAHLRSIV